MRVFIVPVTDAGRENLNPEEAARQNRLRRLLDSYYQSRDAGQLADEICREAGIDRELLNLMARIRFASKRGWAAKQLRELSADR